MKYRFGVLTVSDSTASGQREDKSGKYLVSFLQENLNNSICEYYKVVADEKIDIERNLLYMSDELKLDIILTNGGTGLGPRDWTPEVTSAILERFVPGISEAMRIKTLKYTPYSILSRGVCGIRGNSLIINLPGSYNAVKECMEVIIGALGHALDELKGRRGEHHCHHK